jgi:dihydroorotate dehydrogenase (NAD+) catalytic subunit
MKEKKSKSPKQVLIRFGDMRVGQDTHKSRRTPTVRKPKGATEPMDRFKAPEPVRARVETGAAAVADLGAPAAIRPTMAEREALDKIDLSVDLAPEHGGLILDNPILVASGTFGYGVEYGEVVDVQRIGAICCKGTTLRPRAGNPPPRVTETPGGMLNSIGLQNPGVDAVIEKYGPIWQGWTVPVIVNVAGESIEDYVEVAKRLDGVPGVAGIELNISCPNVGKGGLQFAIDRDAARAVTAAVRRATELPLLVKLSPNVADVRPIAKAIEEAGADAICAINTLSGLAVSPDRTRAFLGNTSGGLSGPAVKPVALRIVYEVAQVVSIPIVAIGGVTNLDDVLDFLACGAVAVQVGTAIFADPELPVRLGDELRAECLRRGLFSYGPLIGTALPKRTGAPSAKGAEYRP